MKKLLSLILVCTLLLGLAACAGSGSNAQGGSTTTAKEEKGVFSVGYGKANITPEVSVPLQGYGRVETRYSTGLLSYLWATCCAITDADGNTILIYGLDLCASNTAVNYRDSISAATGVPVDNICLSASHTHSAPATANSELAGIPEYLKLLEKQLVAAGVAAMEDRKPAEMYGATVETQGLNFVRHYLMNDGTYAGDNFGSTESGYASHATEVDNSMQLIKFVREGGSDIILTNFQTHPHRTGGSKKYDISADIVGEYRDAMESAMDCKVVYFTGAAGNVNPTSRITEENIYSDFREHGQAMAKAALSAEGSYVQLNTGKVQTAVYNFTGQINHEDDAIAMVAKEIYDMWARGEITNSEVKEVGATYGIVLQSPYHASGIYNRSQMGASSSFNIWAFSFGDVGFVVAPYEMFDTSGMYIKENSPFEMTIVAECANGANGYFPSEFTFSHGSYETNTTKYVCGTAEALADQYLAMLNEQYNNR